MDVIAAEPTAYQAASALFGESLGQQLTDVYETLLYGLSGTEQMAGRDSAGIQWGNRYYDSASSIMRGIASTQTAAIRMAELLQQTGFNHALAEASSGAVMTDDLCPWSGIRGITSLCTDVPMAAGGSGDYPDGWDLVRDLVGFEWPDGQPGRLRAAAAGWLAAARALTAMPSAVDAAIASVREQSSPEVEDAVTVCGAFRDCLGTLGSQCTALGQSCLDLAHHIDQVHGDVRDALEELLWEAGATEVLGAIGSFFTFGGAEVVAQGGEAVEAAVVASRITAMLTTFSARVMPVVTELARVADEADTVATLLKPVLDAQKVVAQVDPVPVAVPPGAPMTVVAQAQARLMHAKASLAVGYWRNPAVLEDHYRRHGADFGAASASDYAELAREFYLRGMAGQLQKKVSPDGTVRFYDSASNSFGSFGVDGTTKTYFKPSSQDYWTRQPGVPG